MPSEMAKFQAPVMLMVHAAVSPSIRCWTFREAMRMKGDVPIGFPGLGGSLRRPGRPGPLFEERRHHQAASACWSSGRGAGLAGVFGLSAVPFI